VPINRGVSDFHASPELDAAIERLYEVFAAPAPEFIPACACCNVGTDWEPGGFQGGTVRLPPLGNGRPLRDLTDDNVRGYVWDALLTAGRVADFKYYLPRLFELMARDEHGWDAAALTQRLERWAAFSTWSPAERQAVTTFFVAWWERTINTQRNGRPVEEVLCAISAAEADLDPFLLSWLEPGAAASLTAFIEYERPKLERGGLIDAYWEPRGLQQVVAFVEDVLSSS
jgi:hypothetical protein